MADVPRIIPESLRSNKAFLRDVSALFRLRQDVARQLVDAVHQSPTLHLSPTKAGALAERLSLDPEMAGTVAATISYLLHAVADTELAGPDVAAELRGILAKGEAAGEPAVVVPEDANTWFVLTPSQRAELQAHGAFSVPPTYLDTKVAVALLTDSDNPRRFHAGFLWTLRFVATSGHPDGITLSISPGELREVADAIAAGQRELEAAQRVVSLQQ